MNPDAKKTLLELGLSDSEATLYLAMAAGNNSAHELLKATGLKRPTLYYALGGLERRGLVSKTGIEGEKHFSLTPPAKLATLAEEKVEEATELHKRLTELAKLLATENASNERPSVEYFEGTAAVKATIMDMLYAKKYQINSIVPQDNFFWQHGGREFAGKFVTERKKRGIHTKNLWEQEVDAKTLKDFYDGFSEVRILPKVMKGNFKTSVFLYDDKTLYVSSLKNGYAILITSQEHNATQQAWFDGLWSASKAHKK